MSSFTVTLLTSLFPSDSGYFHLLFHCTGLGRQLSLLKHIFAQCLPLLPPVCCLRISGPYDLQLDQQDTMLFLEFLHLFNAVQIVHVTGYCLKTHIARMLGELSREKAAEVLLMLHTLGDFYDVKQLVTLKPFIDACQLSGHPVVVTR
jgi:hypothetical protein